MADREHEALARLVALKDGPRDDTYRATKEAAWQEARDALAAAAAPPSPEGGGLPEDVRERAMLAASSTRRSLDENIAAAAEVAYAAGLAAAVPGGGLDREAEVKSLFNPRGPYAHPRPGTWFYSFSPWPHEAADPALAHLCALIPVRIDGYFTTDEFTGFRAALERTGMTLREVERRPLGAEDTDDGMEVVQ